MTGRSNRRRRTAITAVLISATIISRALFAQQAPATMRATSTAPAAQATIAAPGSIAPFYAADLYAKDSGYISEVKADIGDHVKKGDLLAVIDDPELAQHLTSMEAMLAAKEESEKAAESVIEQAKAAVEVARRQLAGLEADRELAQATLKRQEALFAGKGATSQQMDEMRAKAKVAGAAADVATAKITAAEADLRAAQANRSVAAAQTRVAAAEASRTRTLLAYTKIVAPFDGVITRRLVNPGDLVQAATASRTTPLFTCQKLDVVRVFCEVPEASAAGIRPGVKTNIRLFGLSGQTISGAVTRVATSVDPATRTMRAEIDLPNPAEALRPGMYAEVTLTPEPPARIADIAPVH